jgi:hypothetical protein
MKLKYFKTHRRHNISLLFMVMNWVEFKYYVLNILENLWRTFTPRGDERPT